MIKKRSFLYFPITFIVMLIFSSYITQGESKNVLINKCPDYKDSRIFKRDQNSITIPVTRTSQIAYKPGPTYSNYSITFDLVASSESEYLLLCQLNSTELKEFLWAIPNDITNLQPRNFSNVLAVSSNRHTYSYFTEAGYFYDVTTGNYYDTEKYCVQS